MSKRLLPLFVAILVLAISQRSPSQPTYKLDVKPELKPLATLKLEGDKLTRTSVKDDPGFRLQYHFKKDGKTATTVDARSAATLPIPQKEAGTYTVALELFYPAYKGGTAQKGEFKPISNVVTFKIEPGAKPTDPVKVVLLETPMPPMPPKPPEKAKK
jgi:hypothetical protein